MKLRAPGRIMSQFAGAVLIPFLMGCAHSSHTTFKADLAEEPAYKDYSDLRAEAKRVVDAAPGLTDAQKKQLVELKESTSLKLDSTQQEIFKLKALLLKNLVEEKYSRSTVEKIERQIRTLTHEKVETFFRSIERANGILGKASKKEEIINSLHLDRTFHMFRDGTLD